MEETLAKKDKECEHRLAHVDRLLAEKDDECRIKVEAVQHELSAALDRHHEELQRRGEAHAYELIRLQQEYRDGAGPDTILVRPLPDKKSASSELSDEIPSTPTLIPATPAGSRREKHLASVKLENESASSLQSQDTATATLDQTRSRQTIPKSSTHEKPAVAPDSYDAAVIETQSSIRKAAWEERREKQRAKAEQIASDALKPTAPARAATGRTPSGKSLNSTPRSFIKTPESDVKLTPQMVKVHDLQSSIQARLKGITSRLDQLSGDRRAVGTMARSDEGAGPKSSHNRRSSNASGASRQSQASSRSDASGVAEVAEGEISEVIQAMNSLIAQDDEFKAMRR